MAQPQTHLGEIFREDFSSPFDVAQNGGVVVGTPSINNGVSLGSDDYIEWGNLPSLKRNIGFIVSFLVKGDPLTANAGILTNNASHAILTSAANTSVEVSYFDSDGKIYFQIGHNSSVKSNLGIAQESWLDGTWHRYTASWDGTTAADSMKVFVDEQLVGSKAASATGMNMFNDKLRLGKPQLAPGITAEVKDLQFWGRGFSVSEVSDLHNNAMFSYLDNDAHIYPLHDKVGESRFTTSDVAGGIDLTFGDGSTLSTFPDAVMGRNGALFATGKYLDGGLIPDTYISNPTGSDISWGAWIRPTTLAGSTYYILSSGGQTSSTGVSLSINASRNVVAIITTETHTATLTSNKTLDAGRRYFVLASYRAEDNHIHLLIDSEEDSNKALVPTTQTDTQTRLSIGAPNTALTSFNFIGEINEVFFMKKFLTPIQRYDRYLKGPYYLGN